MFKPSEGVCRTPPTDMLPGVNLVNDQLEERLRAADGPAERAAILKVDLEAVTEAARFLFALAVVAQVILLLMIVERTYAAGVSSSAHSLIGAVGGVLGFFLGVVVTVASRRSALTWIRIAGAIAGSAIQVLFFALAARLGEMTPAVLSGLLSAAVIIGVVPLSSPTGMRRALNAKRLNAPALIRLRESPGWMWGEGGRVVPLVVLTVTTMLGLGLESVVVVFEPELVWLPIVLSATVSVFTVLWQDTPARQYPLWIAYAVILGIAFLASR